MVTQTIQDVIKSIFPKAEINSYCKGEAYIQVPKLSRDKLIKLIDETKDWSGCMWYVRGDMDCLGHAQIHFKHVAFTTTN